MSSTLHKRNTNIPSWLNWKAGRGTRMCRPRNFHKSRTSCLYAMWRYRLWSGPSKGASYCDLYCSHAISSTHWFKQAGENPGCSIMHDGLKPPITSAAWYSASLTCGISMQERLSFSLGVALQLPQVHLKWMNEWGNERNKPPYIQWM